MHTYRRYTGHWEVGFHDGDMFTQVGPNFGVECEAAAYASFLNGGRYNPYEIEALFRLEPTLVDDDSTHPERPEVLDDYQQERKRG